MERPILIVLEHFNYVLLEFIKIAYLRTLLENYDFIFQLTLISPIPLSLLLPSCASCAGVAAPAGEVAKDEKHLRRWNQILFHFSWKHMLFALKILLIIAECTTPRSGVQGSDYDDKSSFSVVIDFSLVVVYVGIVIRSYCNLQVLH